MVNHALSQYRRNPGFDVLTRVHASSVGNMVLDALVSALSQASSSAMTLGYIEIRHRLRWHIVRYPQQRLVDEGHATDAMRDDLFAINLGL